MVKNNMDNIKYGIVQGRLIQSPDDCLQWFPQEYWESEFFIANSLGYNYIELIAERQNNDKNPIWSDTGIKKIKSLAKRNNLSLHALCNDYIIGYSITGNKKVMEQMVKFISRAGLLGAEKIIVPFFEESELNENNFKEYKSILIEIADIAQKYNILVCIETILNGKNLVKFLEQVNHENVKCVFDTGNRVACGHDIYSDILLLKDKIQHVHIKDKNKNNENVVLGTGMVNFQKVIQSLLAIQYNGPYTFETNRGNNAEKTAQFQKSFIEFLINNEMKS